MPRWKMVDVDFVSDRFEHLVTGASEARKPLKPC